MGKKAPARQDQTRNMLMYKQVEQDIRNKIQQGEWPAGSMLPSRANLAKLYSVSIPTIEQAIGLLISDGTVRAEPKRGTFVSQSVQKTEPPSVSMYQPSVFSGSTRSSAIPTLGFLFQSPHIYLPPGTLLAPASPEPDDWTYLLMQSLQHNVALVGGQIRMVQEIGPTFMHTTVKEAITLLLDHDIDAIVMSIFDARMLSETARALFDLERVPVVLASWEEIVSSCPCVCFDDVASGYKAALHLLRVGYTPPYHFVYSEDYLWVNKRIEGIKKAMQDFGISPEHLIIHSPPTSAERDNETIAYLMGQQLIAQGILDMSLQEHPLAVIARNDQAAAGFLRAAQERGKIAGKDFGLVGFDNSPRAVELGITSIRPAVEEMGEEVIRLLWQQLQERRSSLQRILLAGRLLVRSSTSRGRNVGSQDM